ncbi:MAG: hypothetical protein JRI22_07885 [Deltaproteobacteria bacterium]|nr:hypothetical protein [Deltaproteobacteria bacterium]
MRIQGKLSEWGRSIQRYAIPLIIIAVLFTGVAILFKGRFGDILRLLMPSEERPVKTEEPVKVVENLPPAGIEQPPAEVTSPLKPSPDSPIATKEIDNYLNALLKQQSEEYSATPTPPIGSEMVAARQEPPPDEKRPGDTVHKPLISPKAEELSVHEGGSGFPSAKHLSAVPAAPGGNDLEAGEGGEKRSVSTVPSGSLSSQEKVLETPALPSHQRPPSSTERHEESTSAASAPTVLKSAPAPAPGTSPTARSAPVPGKQVPPPGRKEATQAPTVLKSAPAPAPGASPMARSTPAPGKPVPPPGRKEPTQAPTVLKSAPAPTPGASPMARSTPAPGQQIHPPEQEAPGLTRWVRKSPLFQIGPPGDLITRQEIGKQNIPVVRIPFPPKEIGVLGGSDLLIMPGQEVWVKGKKIPIREMIRLIREKRPSEQNDLFGLRIVRPGDNIWNIHFDVIKAFFLNQRGIHIPPLIDEPDERRRSSGVGKILKFSETIGVSYNLMTRKIMWDPNFLIPGQEIYFFRMKDILSVLEGVSVAELNKFAYDGRELVYLGRRVQRKTVYPAQDVTVPKGAPPPSEIKVQELR